MIDAFAVDTHAIVWYSAGILRKLGREARESLEAVESDQATLYVPAAVVLETWLLAGRGIVRAETTISAWWRRFHRPNVVFVEMTAEDVWAAAELDWEHRDWADRLIVSAALRLGVPLVTADEAITRWGGVPVLW